MSTVNRTNAAKTHSLFLRAARAVKRPTKNIAPLAPMRTCPATVCAAGAPSEKANSVAAAIYAAENSAQAQTITLPECASLFFKMRAAMPEIRHTAARHNSAVPLASYTFILLPSYVILCPRGAKRAAHMRRLSPLKSRLLPTSMPSSADLSAAFCRPQRCPSADLNIEIYL